MWSGDAVGYGRDPVKKVSRTGEESYQKPDGLSQQLPQGVVEKSEDEEDVAAGHDQRDKRDGGEIEKERRERDSMEGESYDGQDSELGGHREYKNLADSQRKAREVFDEPGEEEDDRQGCSKRQLKTDMEKLVRVEEQ